MRVRIALHAAEAQLRVMELYYSIDDIEEKDAQCHAMIRLMLGLDRIEGSASLGFEPALRSAAGVELQHRVPVRFRAVHAQGGADGALQPRARPGSR